MKFLTKKRSSAKGFTLIELLVVIAIIGVLASIVLASLNTARKKSRDTRRVADMNQAKLALELYFDSNRSYPLDVAAATPAGLVPTFIATWPSDPLGGLYEYDGLVADANTNTSNLCGAAPCAFFHTGATVEDNTIAAMSSRAKRCPAATANSTTCPQLDSTIINGLLAPKCDNTGAAPYGCYDVTP